MKKKNESKNSHLTYKLFHINSNRKNIYISISKNSKHCGKK